MHVVQIEMVFTISVEGMPNFIFGSLIFIFFGDHH
jgi:hypothetical protein